MKRLTHWLTTMLLGPHYRADIINEVAKQVSSWQHADPERWGDELTQHPGPESNAWLSVVSAVLDHRIDTIHQVNAINGKHDNDHGHVSEATRRNIRDGNLISR